MKKLLLYIAVFTLTAGSICAQEETPSTTLRPSKVESTYKFDYKTEYLLEEAQLKACFKNGIIPANLPKLSENKSEDAFRVAVGKYINENPYLFVAEEVKKYGYTVVEKPVLSEEEIQRAREAKFKRTTPISDAELKETEAKHQNNQK